MKFKHLITSGCSFSDNIDNRWPHWLAQEYNLRLYNYGHGSAGNDYISQSIIFKIHDLINQGVNPSEIAVFVMWSGIDRQGIFISSQETVNYDSLLNEGQANPINFLFMTEKEEGRFIPLNPVVDGYPSSGWLLGSPHCSWLNENITDFKKLHFENFYTHEYCYIKSFLSMLQVQWLCENKGIYLKNMTYMNLFENNNYENTKHLQDLIDFSKWIFWNDRDGLFEYTRDNNLPFYEDDFHPLPESHLHFIKNWICPKIW